jgi:hypothetical protein
MHHSATAREFICNRLCAAKGERLGGNVAMP